MAVDLRTLPGAAELSGVALSGVAPSASATGTPGPAVADVVAGLDELPAARVAEVLDGLQLPALTGTETVLALAAAKRLRNYADGLIYRYARETLRRTDARYGQRPDPTPGSVASEALVGVNEVRAALDLSREQAIGFCATARRLDGPLWPLQQAMLDGDLDAARVRVFDRETRHLSNEDAEGVAIDLSYPAPHLTERELAEQIRRSAIEADPRAAAKRQAAALAGRRVQVTTGPDGTATIAGRQLPMLAAAMAAERLDTLARAARRAGHPGTVRRLRAEIYLGKLTGRFDGINDHDLVTVLLAEAGIDPDHPVDAGARSETSTMPDSAPAPCKSTMDSATGDEGISGDRAPGDGDGAGGGGDGDGGGHGNGDEDFDDVVWFRMDQLRQEAGLNDDADSDEEPCQHEPDDHKACDHRAIGDNGDEHGVCFGHASDRNGPARRVHGRGLRLTADVTTIAGLTHQPGKLLGWGVLHPELARRVASTPHAKWWYVLTENDGSLVDVVELRNRPHEGWAPDPTPDPNCTDYRGLECWLRLTRDDLALLEHDPPPGWQPVITELVASIAARPGGPPNADPRRRFPTAALRRWVGVRDGTCVFLTCDQPAHESDVDHSTDYADGGDTLDDNLAALCNDDHRSKHFEGWRCYQDRPGCYTWISPLQVSYLVIPAPRPGLRPRLLRVVTRHTPPDTYLGVPAEPPPPF